MGKYYEVTTYYVAEKRYRRGRYLYDELPTILEDMTTRVLSGEVILIGITKDYHSEY